MITQFFPRDFQRYLSLPVLGPLMDPFAVWLRDRRYTRRSGCYELRMAVHISKYLKRRAVERVEDLSEEHLNACHRLFQRKFLNEAGSVRVLQRFLREGGWLQAAPAPEPSRTEIQLQAFKNHLQNTCGFVPSTVQRQATIAAEFLVWLKFEQTPERLSSLTLEEIDEFFKKLSKRLGRVGMQKPIATLRHLLRFWAANGLVPSGMDSRIETPRIYRQEQLPRALPWPTVQAFLQSINRNSANGKRDFAIFTMMATYGLRSCDIVALTLDDIYWRAGCIRICQSKTGRPLELPITDHVASALLDYLHTADRYGDYRQLFLRHRAPGGVLKPTAVTEAFQGWSKRSGLDIPYAFGKSA